MNNTEGGRIRKMKMMKMIKMTEIQKDGIEVVFVWKKVGTVVSCTWDA